MSDKKTHHRVSAAVPHEVLEKYDRPEVRELLAAQITLEVMRYYLEQEHVRWSTNTGYAHGWSRNERTGGG